jgi:hypothetical protein
VRRLFRLPFYVVGNGPDGTPIVAECGSRGRAERLAAKFRLAGADVDVVSSETLVARARGRALEQPVAASPEVPR